MITRGMDVCARQPLASALQLLHQLLLDQMEQLDVLLGHDDQTRQQRMEADGLDFPGALDERELRLALGYLNQNNAFLR